MDGHAGVEKVLWCARTDRLAAVTLPHELLPERPVERAAGRASI